MKGGNIVILALIVLLLAGAGGYQAYQIVKYTPPAWLVSLVTKRSPPPPLPAGDAAPITVPVGFAATIYSRDTPGARVMTRDQKGTMLVSETGGGKVVALPDLDGDGKADRVVTVLENLNKPHGVLVDCTPTGRPCTLYVAETGELKSYAYDADTHSAVFEKSLAKFPTGDGHFTRTLQMAPDGMHLLISIGSSCNACTEATPLRASVQSLDLATGALTTYATGLRNSVFMAIDPVLGNVWATENGRDILGDDIPPDEVNILEQGKDYGWPICYGQNIHDTDFDPNKYTQSDRSENPCKDRIPAWIDLQAHTAALGLTFVPEEGWPEEYWSDVLIALHGSWNRSTPSGYKVIRVKLDQKTRKPIGEVVDFATGFLPEGSTNTKDAIGRPVGVMAEPGGTVYISDDLAGAIYKVSRTEP